jgi:hypothetical protein
MHPAMTYTLLALCGALLVFSFAVEQARSPALAPLRKYGPLLTLLSLLGAFAVLAPGRGVDGRVAVQASVAARQPLFIEFFSNT